MKGVKPKNFEEMQKKGWDAVRGSKRPLKEETKIKIGLANKGRKATEETRKILSEARKRFYSNGGVHPRGNLGRKTSEETRRKLSEALKGEKSPAWKGGVTPENERQRKSIEYTMWREQVFERDNWECQECHTRSGRGSPVTLNADHIKPFALFPELRFVVENGRTLCAECHNIVTSKQHKEGVFARSVATRFKRKEQLALA